MFTYVNPNDLFIFSDIVKPNDVIVLHGSKPNDVHNDVIVRGGSNSMKSTNSLNADQPSPTQSPTSTPHASNNLVTVNT